jgi:hypothetical protein
MSQGAEIVPDSPPSSLARCRLERFSASRGSPCSRVDVDGQLNIRDGRWSAYDAQEISLTPPIVGPPISGDQDLPKGGLGAMFAVKAQARLFALHSARQIVIVRWFYPVPPAAIQRAARFSTWAPNGTRVWR